MAEMLRELDLTPTAYTLAPCWPAAAAGDFEPPYYGLFVERGDLPAADAGERLAGRLDARLRQLNIEYDAKRGSGRLGPVRAEVVPTGFWQRWDRERLERTGGTLEQYKHPCLLADPKFAEQATREGTVVSGT
jgi:hypothetical protein